MAKGKIRNIEEVNTLNSLYNYLRREVSSQGHLQTRFSDSELALILDRSMGIRGYEQGTAQQNENTFTLQYLGIRDSALRTFSNPAAVNYNITTLFQRKISETINLGEGYREKGDEQVVLVKNDADMRDVKDFFEFLLGVFKEKLT